MECTETLVLAAVLNRFLVPRAQSKALNETRVMDFLSKTVDKNDFWPIFRPQATTQYHTLCSLWAPSHKMLAPQVMTTCPLCRA